MAVNIPDFWKRILERGTGLTPEESKVVRYMFQVGPYNELGKQFFPYDTESNRYLLPSFDNIDQAAFLHGDSYQEADKSWKLRPMLYPGEESSSGGFANSIVEGIRNAGSKVTSAIGNAIDYTMQEVIGSDVMKNISEITPEIAKVAIAAMTAYAGGVAMGGIDAAAAAGAEAGAAGITGAGAGEALASELAASSLAEGAVGAGAGITGTGAGEALAEQLATAALAEGTGITGAGAGEALASQLAEIGFTPTETANILDYAQVAATADADAGVAGMAGVNSSGSNALLQAATNTPVSPLVSGGSGGTGGGANAPTVNAPTDTSFMQGVTNFLTKNGIPITATLLNYIANTDAARRAANMQADAAQNSTNAVMTQYWQNRADLAPWREAGVNALGELVKKVNAGPGEFTASPGYQFRLNEGTKAIERSAAARGSQLSGGTLKALNRFGQDYATSDYDNFLRRYYESLTPYQSLAGVGQTATNTITNQGTNAANVAAQNALTAGQAQAGGAINQANALTGAVNSGLNNYLMWKYLNNDEGTKPQNVSTVPSNISNYLLLSSMLK